MAAGDGPRDFSPALIDRDRFVIEDLLARSAGQPLAVAELSVGDGRMTLAMLSSIQRVRLTCAEISELRIEQLRSEIAEDPLLSDRMPDFIACNFDTDFVGFPDNTFDAVVALDIMEHVIDVFGFVANCHRVLRPGGSLYLRVPNIAYIKHRFRLLLGQLPVTASWYGTRGDLHAWRDIHGWDGGHLHLFTIDILARLLREGSFEILSCDDPGTRLAGMRKLWPNLLFANPLIIAQKS